MTVIPLHGCETTVRADTLSEGALRILLKPESGAGSSHLPGGLVGLVHEAAAAAAAALVRSDTPQLK